LPAIFCIYISFSLLPPSASAFETKITIAAGDQAGLFFRVGKTICQLVNDLKLPNPITCSVKSSAGTISDLLAFQDFKQDLAIIQTDWLIHAYKGSSIFRSKGANNNLRNVFSLHTEYFTILARNDSGILKIADLAGKRVNIGNSGSGQRTTMEVVMRTMHWEKSDFSKVSKLPAGEQISALCEDEIDAAILWSAHPSYLIKEVIDKCDSHLVEVSGPGIDKLLQFNYLYSPTAIIGATYKNTPEPITTFSTTTGIVSSSHVPIRVINKVVQAVFDNFDQFRDSHTALEDLFKKEIAKNSTPVPRHEGASRYFEEKKLGKRDALKLY